MGQVIGPRVRVSLMRGAKSARAGPGRRRPPAAGEAALRRVLVLGVCWAGVLGVAGVAPAAAETRAKTCHPQVGAEGKARFTVWYCRGDELGHAASQVVALRLDKVWSRETVPEPNGLGPPIAPVANGGRISVYVTAPGEAVDLGKCPEFCQAVGEDYGFARPVAPFSKNRDGGLSSSGALVVNEEKGLNDATVIHEFFHVLQFRYSWPAVGTWLGEAMATWAEHKYGAVDTSQRLNYFKDFQRDTSSGLTARGNGHEYGAYVWLIWLAQHTGSDRTVFGLWSALQRAPARADTLPPESLSDVIDRRAFDSAVREYLAAHRLSWAQHFKSFAVEDLNPVPPLSPKLPPHQFGRGRFGDPLLDSPALGPDFVRSPIELTVGRHRTAVGPSGGDLGQLGAQYEYIPRISDQVKAVKVTPRGMKPWGDLVVLAHTHSRWLRRDLQDGSVTLCRTSDPVDQLYLIADNHGLAPHSASYTVTGERSCARRRRSRPHV
jgi:hypothetical protein